MTKQEYAKARRLIRGNGAYALRWMDIEAARVMHALRIQAHDHLAARIIDRAQGYGPTMSFYMNTPNHVWQAMQDRKMDSHWHPNVPTTLHQERIEA